MSEGRDILRFMPLEAMSIGSAVIVVILALVLVGARSTGRSRRREALRELGFASVENLPSGFEHAMRELHAPKAKREDVKFRHPLRRRLRWGDLYHADLQFPSDDDAAMKVTGHGLSGYNAQWRLPKVKVLITKEPETLMEGAIVKALHHLAGKLEGRIELHGTGPFEKRAFVYGNSEAEARQVLTHRLQQALLNAPYAMLEMQGAVFTHYIPAQAGSGKDTKEDWRALMDTCRAVGEELTALK